MAKTNWQDPGSSEIISPHVSGLQEAVGKIQSALDMKTITEVDIPLTEVYISDSDRYRIFQSPEGKRNWCLSPTPIIKKNGNAITTGDGFTVEYGGGAIILSVSAARPCRCHGQWHPAPDRCCSRRHIYRPGGCGMARHRRSPGYCHPRPPQDKAGAEP